MGVEQITAKQREIQALQGPESAEAEIKKYQNVYVDAVNSGKNDLDAAAKSFASSEAKAYAEKESGDIAGTLGSMAARGREIIQAYGEAGENKPEKIPSLEELSASLKSQLDELKADLGDFREVEKMRSDFDREKAADDKDNQSMTLDNLETIQAGKESRVAALTKLGERQAAFAPKNISTKPFYGIFANFSQEFYGLKSAVEIDLDHCKDGVKARNKCREQRDDLLKMEKELPRKNKLTQQEYDGYLTRLNRLETQWIVGDSLKKMLDDQYLQPTGALAERLHLQIEKKKPAELQEPRGENQEAILSARAAHDEAEYLRGIPERIPQMDTSAAALEQELDAAKKNPDQWLLRPDYEAWNGKLSVQQNELNKIQNKLPKLEDRISPIQNRLKALAGRSAERLKNIEEYEKNLVADKVTEMTGKLEDDWKGQANDEALLGASAVLAGLKEGGDDYQKTVEAQDKLFTFLLGFEGKVGVLLSKPDQYDTDTHLRLTILNEQCKKWKDTIIGDRALTQIRKAQQPDQTFTWDEEEGKPKETLSYSFNDWIEFINPLDPSNEKINGGRGWKWKDDGWNSDRQTGLPRTVRLAFAQQADKIAFEQKTAALKDAGTEQKKFQQDQERLSGKAREVLGEKANDYFKAVDLLGQGKTAEAIESYKKYLALAETFTPEEKELHQSCIDDAKRQAESNDKFPEFLEAMSLAAGQKLDEALPKFRAFIDKVSALPSDERKQYAEQLSTAVEMVRQVNSSKLALLEDLYKDCVFIQDKEISAAVSGPHAPLAGPEIVAINRALGDLKAKIEKGTPPVDFEKEFSDIKNKLAEFEKSEPGAHMWTDPDGSRKASSPTSRMLYFFGKMDSSDSKVREAGFAAMAKEFKDLGLGMHHTQKWLDMAMTERYRNFEAGDNGATKDAVKTRMETDSAVTQDVESSSREMYQRWAAEQNPPVTGVDPLVYQGIRTQVFQSMFDIQYKREIRKKMTDRGDAALEKGKKKFEEEKHGMGLGWDMLPPEEKMKYLDNDEDRQAATALLSEDSALKLYNWSMPYKAADARWYKPWTWSDYNEDDFNQFKKGLQQQILTFVVTLPIGFGAGSIGKLVGTAAMKTLAAEGLSETAVEVLATRGLSGLMAAAEGGGASVWSGLSLGTKAALMTGWGAGVAAEGGALAVMNGAWEGISTGESALFDAFGSGKFGKAALSLLKSIGQAGMFRGVGALQEGVMGLAGKNPALLSKILTGLGGETVSGVGGAYVEALFDATEGRGMTFDGFAASVLQNAAGSAGSHVAHGAYELAGGSAERTRIKLEQEAKKADLEKVVIKGSQEPAGAMEDTVMADHAVAAGHEEPTKMLNGKNEEISAASAGIDFGKSAAPEDVTSAGGKRSTQKHPEQAAAPGEATNVGGKQSHRELSEPQRETFEKNPEPEVQMLTPEKRRELLTSLEEALRDNSAAVLGLIKRDPKLTPEAIREKVNGLPDSDLTILAANTELPSEIVDRIISKGGDQMRDVVNGQSVVVRYYVGGDLEAGGIGKVSDVYYVVLDSEGRPLPDGPELRLGAFKEAHNPKNFIEITAYEAQSLKKARDLQARKHVQAPLYIAGDGRIIMPKIESMGFVIPLEKDNPSTGKTEVILAPDGRPAMAPTVNLKKILPQVAPDQMFYLVSEHFNGIQELHESGHAHLDAKISNGFYGTIDGKPAVVLGDIAMVSPQEFVLFNLLSPTENFIFLGRNGWESSFPITPGYYSSKYGGPMFETAIAYVKQKAEKILSPEDYDLLSDPAADPSASAAILSKVGELLTPQERGLLVDMADRGYIMRDTETAKSAFNDWCDKNPKLVSPAIRERINGKLDGLMFRQKQSPIRDDGHGNFYIDPNVATADAAETAKVFQEITEMVGVISFDLQPRGSFQRVNPGI